jgi:hypothetical protein
VDCTGINLSNAMIEESTPKENSLLIPTNSINDLMGNESEKSNPQNVTGDIFKTILSPGLGWNENKKSFIRNTMYSSLAVGLCCSPCFAMTSFDCPLS